MNIAITGPTGTGKSTIGDAVAKKLDKCVNIDADHIKHMIVGGFYKDESNAGGWSFSEWALVGESIGLLAKNFNEKGFNVIINGYIDKLAWSEIEKIITFDHMLLLLPDANTNKLRDVGRSEDIQMGEASVDEHQNHFRTEPIYEGFTKLDTSNETVEQSVSRIMEMLTQ